MGSEMCIRDSFAGSGALGCEALSRGAARVTFVEQSRECVAVIKRNTATLQAHDVVTVIKGDARAFVNACRETYDSSSWIHLTTKALPRIWPLMYITSSTQEEYW